jgi:sugar lactone lactonase YvrE
MCRSWLVRTVASLSLVSALAVAGRADSLYAVSSSGGSIGTYSTVTGAAINASLVTGLTTPEAIAFDPALNFYVTGFTGQYVAKYQQDGTLINSAYLTFGDFNQPSGVAVNGAGEIFVVNNGLMPYEGGSECTVSKFQADGTLINAGFVPVPGSPAGALIDGSDLYVVRWADSAVGKYTSSGTSGTILDASFLTPGAEIDTWRPFNIARDSVGNYYVTGNAPFTDESMVSKFAPNGTLINARLISFPAFDQAYGLAIDSADNLYVGGYGATTVGKYRADGTVVNASFITGLPSVTSLAIQPVPEPSAIVVAGLGLGGLAWRIGRRRDDAA